MDQFKTGDTIEHRLMPGFTMPVLDTRDCEIDGNRPESHLAYKVEDPDGNVLNGRQPLTLDQANILLSHLAPVMKEEEEAKKAEKKK